MAQVTIEQALQLALQYHQGGQLAEAEQLYRRVLAVVPDHPDVLHHLGIIALQVGRAAVAAELIGRALELRPGVAEVLGNYGTALRALGRVDEAIAVLGRASQAEPRPWHFNNLGNALRDKGLAQDAVLAYQRAIELQADYAEAHHHLGLALLDMRQPGEALGAFHRALELQPASVDALNQLVGAYLAMGELDKPAGLLAELLERQPGYAEAHYNLGLVRRRQGLVSEALECFGAALRLRCDYAEAHNERGTLLSQLGEHSEALVEMQRASELASGDATVWYNYGTVAQVADEIDLSLACFAKALEFAPDEPNIQNNYGNALKESGQLDEAIRMFRRAAQHGRLPAAGSNWVYTLHFHPGFDAAAIGRAAREWDQLFGEPLRRASMVAGRNSDPARRLRIGYVSPDFRHQAEAFFVLPLFEAHDHRHFEIHCYSSVRQADELTERHRATADVWHEVAHLSDEELAGQIRADGIDILVDLTMQMGYNRSLLFARKPAPVQVTWLAYPGTTGLGTMDYRITDWFMDPEGTDEACYSEKSIRLPDSWCCYDPLDELPEPGVPPASTAGRITFGSLNAFYKLNEEVVGLWANVLHAVGGSRLLLLAPPGAHRERLRGQFGKRGITAERIEFVGRQSRRAYLQTYQRIDIALDPFPYNGITSTCDALWMGVPVISRLGQRASERAGLSLLSAAGRPEWVARNDQEFIMLAARLAGDIDALGNLRAGMREQVAKSALADGRRFARCMEAAYREMWHDWCAGQPAS